MKRKSRDTYKGWAISVTAESTMCARFVLILQILMVTANMSPWVVTANSVPWSGPGR